MRIIKFNYRDTERVALEIEADKRKINCMYCLQARKGDESDVGHRSFKVPEMMDVQEIENVEDFLVENPEFLEGVTKELGDHDGN